MCYSQEAKEDKAHSLEPNGLELGKAKEEIKEKVQQLMRAADEKAVADVMKDSCGDSLTDFTHLVGVRHMTAIAGAYSKGEREDSASA